MNKEERIKRYGEVAYGKKLQQDRDWRKANPEKVKNQQNEESHKGGTHYERMLKYNTTGLRGERHRIRMKHAKQYCPFKQIIAPETQIHHEWIFGTAEYTGVALVETKPHQYGIIDVIKILEGKITLLSEKEIKEQGGI